MADVAAEGRMEIVSMEDDVAWGWAAEGPACGWGWLDEGPAATAIAAGGRGCMKRVDG